MNEEERVTAYAEFLQGFLLQSLKYNKQNLTDPNQPKAARGKPANTEDKDQKKRDAKT